MHLAAPICSSVSRIVDQYRYNIGWDQRMAALGMRTTSQLRTVAAPGRSTVATAVDLCSRNCNPF